MASHFPLALHRDADNGILSRSTGDMKRFCGCVKNLLSDLCLVHRNGGKMYVDGPMPVEVQTGSDL